MTCNCIEHMDAKLAEYNTKLGVTFAFRRDGSSSTFPAIMTEKIEKRVRKGPAIAAPTFCPFCGERYRQAAPSSSRERTIRVMRDALSQIAAEANVPIDDLPAHTEPNGWRVLATERINIARKTLRDIAGVVPGTDNDCCTDRPAGDSA